LSDPSEIVLRAQRTAHHRAGIRELSRSAPAEARRTALEASLAASDERAALALAFSLASEGALPVALAMSILPDVEEPALSAFLLAGSAGDRLAMLGRLIDEELLTEETEACLLRIATARLDLASPLSSAWLVRVRRQARRLPTLAHTATGAHLEVALAGFTEPVVAELSARDEKREFDRAEVDTDEVLRVWDGGLDAALGEEEAPRLVATVTVRSEGPKVGRNDPCPCGSGKKFKKCHALEKSSEVRGAIDAAALTPHDLAFLRMADLAALDPTKLKRRTLDAAVGRAITYRRWALAEKLAAVLDGPDATDGRLSVALGAIDAGRSDVADRLVLSWPGELPKELVTHRELSQIAPTLASLSDRAAAMLLDPSAPLFELGLGLLHRAPGLGVPFARGLIADLPVEDGDALVEEIERARDLLGLTPGDPAEEFVKVLDEHDAQRAATAKAEHAVVQERDGLRATLARKDEELSARQAEVIGLSMRLEEAEEELGRLSAQGSRVEERPRTASEGESDKKKWSARVEELKALVQEGNKERAALRRQITELTEELEARPRDEAALPEPEPESEGDHDASPRAPVVPVFSKAAAAALPDLPLRIRRQAVELSGTLAAGDPAAWRNVKQMEGVLKVWSARLGIHHRLLFRAHDSELEVLDVVTREDLLKSLERWR
jgi:hypothetical protein